MNPPAIVSESRQKNNAAVERGIGRAALAELFAPQSLAKAKIISRAQHPDKLTAVTQVSLNPAAFFFVAALL